MAHYASDCWDAEIETSYGWVEVAGHADRTCYDLSRHSECSKIELVASRLLKETKVVKGVKINLNKGIIFKNFTDKEKAKKLCEKLSNVNEEEKENLMIEFEKNGKIEVDVNGEKNYIR